MSRFLRGISLFLFPVMLALPGQAQSGEAPDRTVSVGGTATVTATPDQATVRFGIVSEAETAESARQQNAEAAKAAMNAVRDMNVPESKMRMESLRLQPQREYNPETETREQTGYQAAREVVVELSDLEQLPRLIATVVQRGANRLEGISYGLSDRTAKRNDALRQAVTSAHEKARLMATALDAQLGTVREISEQDFGYDQPQPRLQRAFAKSAESDAAPEPDAYAAGEIEISAQVQVVFDLATGQ